MGVRYLTSYLDKKGYRSETLTFNSKEQQDARLVIDCSSFMHHLYRVHCDGRFGGDYINLRRIIKNYIFYFNYCLGWDGQLIDKLTADKNYIIWVMEGKLPRTKKEVRKKRLNESLGTIKNVIPLINKWKQYDDTSNQNIILVPLLASDVMIEVLQEHKQYVYYANEESDSDIAYLAKQYKAYIMSNDSDFFIFLGNRGYVNLNSFFISIHEIDSFDLFDEYSQIIGNIQTCIRLSCSNSSSISRFVNVKEEHLPLLASFIGNDITGHFTFSFVSTLLRLNKDARYNADSRMKAYIGALCQFFNKNKHLPTSSILKQLINNLSVNQTQLEDINKSLKFYKANELIHVESLLQQYSLPTTYDKVDKLYSQGKLCHSFINLVSEFEFWGKPIIEGNLNNSSSWELSLPLRSLSIYLLSTSIYIPLWAYIPKNHYTFEGVFLPTLNDLLYDDNKQDYFEDLKQHITSPGDIQSILSLVSNILLIDPIQCELNSVSKYHCLIIFILKFIYEKTDVKNIFKLIMALLATYCTQHCYFLKKKTLHYSYLNIVPKLKYFRGYNHYIHILKSIKPIISLFCKDTVDYRWLNLDSLVYFHYCNQLETSRNVVLLWDDSLPLYNALLALF